MAAASFSSRRSLPTKPSLHCSSPLPLFPSSFSYCPSGARSPSTCVVVPTSNELKKPPLQPGKKRGIHGQSSNRWMRTALMNSIVKDGIRWKIYAEKALELLAQPLPEQNPRARIKLPPSRLSVMSMSDQDSP